MRFQNSIFALAGLLALSVASPEPEPQSPAQTSAAAAEILSYALALVTDPVAIAFATDAPLMASIDQFEQSLASDVKAGKTPGTSALSVLPTAAQNFILSVYTVEASILSKHGFTSGLGGGQGAAGAPPAATGTPAATTKSTSDAATLKIGAGVLVGFMGVVMAL